MRIAIPQTRESLTPPPTPKGVYRFKCLAATDTHSSTGRPMLTLVHEIELPDGGSAKVRDWLVDGDGLSALKLRDFAEAAGALPDYLAGNLPAERCVGVTGRLRLGIRRARDGYPAQNSVAGYLTT